HEGPESGSNQVGLRKSGKELSWRRRSKVKDISNLIQKYNTSVPITVFNGLNAADRKKYTETLDKLMACQKSIES
ncbi:hypothetical protein ACI3PL_11175, partial [Lacticaseibacillus paracasei]